MSDQGFSFDWRGDEVLRNVQNAAVEAVDEVVADVVVDAKAGAPIDDGDLQADIQARPAEKTSSGARALWGNMDIVYALPREIDKPYLRPAQDATATSSALLSRST